MLLGALAHYLTACFSLNNWNAYCFQTVVKESCLVALDMADYENSEQFQYASVA